MAAQILAELSDFGDLVLICVSRSRLEVTTSNQVVQLVNVVIDLRKIAYLVFKIIQSRYPGNHGFP